MLIKSRYLSDIFSIDNPDLNFNIPIEVIWLSREKEGDLTHAYDKKPHTNRKFENQRATQKRHQNLRLHNDCGPTKDGQLE